MKIGHHPKRKIHLNQPSIFRGKLTLTFRECNIATDLPEKISAFHGYIGLREVMTATAAIYPRRFLVPLPCLWLFGHDVRPQKFQQSEEFAQVVLCKAWSMEWFGGRDGGGWCGVVGGVVGGVVVRAKGDFGGGMENAVVTQKDHQHQWKFPTRKPIDWGWKENTQNQTI